MLYRLLFTILIFSTFDLCPAWADKLTYIMAVQEHYNQKTGTFTCTQRVYEKKTVRTILVRHFPGDGGITWSSDHHTVVFDTGFIPEVCYLIYQDAFL
jgi:hypothetical protein